MKKQFLAAVVVLGFAQIGMANTEFSWFGVSDGVTPALSLNRTVLTYISGNQSIGLVQPSGTPFLSSYDSGDDNFFMAKATIISANRYITEYMSNSGDAFVGKYAYAVVVDLDFASFTSLGNIPSGTQWGVSAISEQIVKTDTAQPTPAQDFSGGPVNLIPEPGSAALVLFGAAAAYWRRRQNRR